MVERRDSRVATPNYTLPHNRVRHLPLLEKNIFCPHFLSPSFLSCSSAFPFITSLLPNALLFDHTRIYPHSQDVFRTLLISCKMYRAFLIVQYSPPLLLLEPVLVTHRTTCTR